MVKLKTLSMYKIENVPDHVIQDMMAFHVYPNGDVYFCWELPHRSQMMNILMSPDLFDPSRVDMIRRWENLQLEYFGFTKDEEGNWVENKFYRGDFLLGSADGMKEAKIVLS